MSVANLTGRLPVYTCSDDWAGKTVVVMGNGFSAKQQDFSLFKLPHVRVMIANWGFKTYPDADVLMLSDRHWLAGELGAYNLSEFKGKQIVVTQPAAVLSPDPRMVYMRRAFIKHPRRFDIFNDPGLLVEGHTSATTCLSMAVLRGAKRIALVGIDLAPGPGNRRSLVDARTDSDERASYRYAKQARHFKMQSEYVKKRRVRVFNCSFPSVLECYPMAKLEDVLCSQ